MAQVTEGACQNGVEGVETLQAAEPPCSVSNGPMKINVKTSASGGLIYKTKHQIAKNMLVYKTASHKINLLVTELLRANGRHQSAFLKKNASLFIMCPQPGSRQKIQPT